MLNKEFPDVDVYLSHSVEDEQTYSEYDGPDWVTEFRAALETSLARELGRETTIWQSSTHLENGSNLVDENLKALENAKVLVVVLSPAYFTYGHSSEKAVSLNEFQMFMRLHEGALEVTPVRVFPVIGQPMPFDQIPDPLKTVRHIDFTVNGSRIEPGLEAFLQKVNELGIAISQSLREIQNIEETPEPAEEEDQAPNVRPTWLCQYRRSEMTSLEDRLAPGLKEEWRINPFKAEDLQDQMKTGDEVVLWRTIDEVKPEFQDKDRGGIVGWGLIESTDYIATKQRIVISVTHSFVDKPAPRDEVLAALNPPNSNWPGQISLKKLDQNEEKVIRRLRPPDKDPQPRSFHETNLSSDRAETTRDRLGRATLAFTLAHHINRIWTEQNKETEKDGKKHEPDEAAFIMHIDSPWGGGKTTFANFVSRILNPKGYVYPDSDQDASNKKSGKFFTKFLKRLRSRRPTNKPSMERCSLFENLRLEDTEYWPAEFAKRQWITVNFNAWQHQHIDPPWWNFYEFIRKQCLQALPFRERYYAKFSEWLWRVWSPELRRTLTVAIVLLLLGSTLWSIDFVQSLVIDLLNDNETAKSTGDAGSSKNIGNFLLLAFFGGSGIAIVRSIRAGVRKVVDSAGNSTDEMTLGTSDPLQRFRQHFSREIERYKRPIIVIVDDLDRCEPEYVVELMRGILTIFRSPRIVFVLLGDKSWIETSFAVVHDEMNKSHRDRNISFGARFAEKAIQLSFILPKPDESSRSEYIESLLIGDGAETNQELKAGAGQQGRPGQSDLSEFRTQTKDKFRNAKSGSQRKAIMETVRASLHDQFGESGGARKAAEQIINDEAVIRAATSVRTEEEIRHGIIDVKSELPDNPRRIKRIINMIAIYQASAQSVLGIVPGTHQWKQLVLWIILISEHPKSWEILVGNPELADEVITSKSAQNSESQKGEKSDCLMLATLNQPNVANLIIGGAFLNEKVQLDTKAVRQLSSLTPLA